MTSKPNLPQDDTSTQEAKDSVQAQGEEITAAESRKPGSIPAFGFPFAMAELAKSRNDKPWYQKSNSSNHDKTPGPAPRGTRRAMGKR
ncbi:MULTISPECIES: hypothetical protein [Pseudomonas]|uniref:hypothetical protein n=1 Tax=Pseudomonas TaxID=286 RepID=UPI0023547B13|nr:MULTISPECIES: hypothetical protein [Pseudomonas]